MDGLSTAASVIAVIQLTGSVVNICGGYIQEVKDARDDIITLQRTAAGLAAILQRFKELLHEPRGTKLSTSSLANNISDCLTCLEALEEKIELTRGRRTMKRLGIRAIKWPLKRKEVDRIITDLERFKSLFTLSLQVDQTALLTGAARNTDQIEENLGLDLLPVARGAEFDSYMDQHEDECLTGTRTELLHQITEWAMSPQSKCIFWLNGKAGTGKSTICRTVARSLREAKLLGASFFFKRGEGDRGNATKLFPTIAQQLMIRMPKLKPDVLKALRDEPDLAGKSLKEQFDKLILQPLLNLDSAKGQVPTTAIVVDALDECENDKDIRVILQLVPQLCASTAVRVRIFLTSRDETPIMIGFSEIGSLHEDFALHDIPEAVTEHDISLFLKHRFAKIRHERNIYPDWPGDETVQALAIMSAPLFISAATVCRFIEDPMWDAEVRLAELLEDQAKYATKMEKTYLPILTQLLKDQDDDESEQLLQLFQQIIGVIILLAIPLSVNSLSQLLCTRMGVITNLLNSFQSVLHIPSNQDMPVRILHLSFRDFLVKSRTNFRVDEQQMHSSITKYCLITMRHRLKRNICDLSGYGTQRKEVSDQLIQQHLPPELQYSCRCWAYHLARCKITVAKVDEAYAFLQKHFLHWVEAMCILGLASEVVGIINILQSALHKDENHVPSQFLYDAKRFFLRNRQIADDVPLQIYYAGLLFAPENAIIRQQFEIELPDRIRVLSGVQERWTADLQTLEGHSGSVSSVAFSPDGRLLASGSRDKTVQLWDAATGALQQTLEEHSDSVKSVAFSPDGKLLASGSRDKTVRLWDAATGTLQHTLEEHSDSVKSVAFSPNGKLLASGSRDKTIRLWDASTGALQHILEGHKDQVRTVVFSPKCQLLASGSRDRTVRLWDAASGALQQTLEDHSDSVESVAFSYNGQLLASGSQDKTIKLWDTDTLSLQQTLKGHSSLVTSVSFAPNSQRLASSSWDGTVRLWDAVTGALQQTLDGHSGIVESVAFSPDGLLLASGSRDNAIWLWDAATGPLRPTLEGHSSLVTSVSFSPNGQRLASSSWDGTVKLWDAVTGVTQQTLQGHLHPVEAIAFSPDSRLLASGSWDMTVRLWDSAKGTPQQTLNGHSNRVTTVVFSPDGRRLASGSWDMTVRLWDAATGALQRTLDGHSNSVDSIAFSPDGQLLASGSRDSTIRLWDSENGALQRTLNGHSNWVTTVLFSPDGRWLVSGPGPRGTTTWLWDPARGKSVSGSWDDTVRLWDAATGALLQIFRVEGRITALKFSGDGSYLITNLGPLYIKSIGGNNPHDTPLENIKICVQDKRWITFHGKKALWLPSEYRPVCSAVKCSTLALGHASGLITFLYFL